MSLFSAPERAAIPEWVDDPATPAADLFAAMAGIVRANAVMGYPALVAALAERELGRPARRILDVGTGLGDIPLHFARRARRRGTAMRAVGIDLNARTIERARAFVAGCTDVELQAVDLFALPEGFGAFDVVTCHRTLHHLPIERVPSFFAALDAVLEPGGVLLVGDLVRGRLCAAVTRLFLSAIGTAPITVRDGVASIRNSFLPAEILALALEGGVSYLRTVGVRPPCHVIVIGTKPERPAPSPAPVINGS